MRVPCHASRSHSDTAPDRDELLVKNASNNDPLIHSSSETILYHLALTSHKNSFLLRGPFCSTGPELQFVCVSVCVCVCAGGGIFMCVCVHVSVRVYVSIHPSEKLPSPPTKGSLVCP